MRAYNTKKPLHGLCNVNVELSSRCNKDCWCCGRRKREKDNPELISGYGDMDLKLARTIATQLPEGIVVQLHNNGEGMLHPNFGVAVHIFHRQITNIVTNGKLLVKRASSIIDHLDTLTVSVIENDPEADEQYGILQEFLSLKGNRKPYTILRLNGEVDRQRYETLALLITTRTLHNPLGSFGYRRSPTIPETGICWDFLHHLSIDRMGRVSICVRFDYKGRGIIGDINQEPLWDIWNGEKRMTWKQFHVQGKRSLVPLCSRCSFWGVPTGKD